MVYVPPEGYVVGAVYDRPGLLIMRLTFDTYWPLLLMLVIPYLWWVQRRTLTDLSPKHLQLSGIIRSTIVALIALALTQPVIYRAGAWISAVYLLDVSQSVAPSAIQSAMQWIQQTNDAGRPDHARFIPFAANSTVLEKLDQMKEVQVANSANRGSIDQSGTNIEDAIDTAIRSFAPHHLKRLVLLSDGNENSGHMLNMLSRLKAEGIHIYAVPSQARTNRDVWIENIMAPAEVTAEELFPLEVHVFSQTDVTAVVEIKHGDKSLGTKTVTLTRGLNRVAFETSVKDDAGPVMIDAEVRASNDPFPENNKFRTSIVVQGRPKILYVESHSESAHYLQSALTNEGLNINTVSPSTIPKSIEELDAYDAVVLSDVARNSLSDQQMKTFATYVRDLGGGFILAGGENNYGEGGYSKTVIEDVLPVTFETKKEKPDTVAMIVVLDKSGSMGGQKIEMTKEAAKAPLALLKDTDGFGVVAFDYNFYWPVKFQPVANRAAISQAISTIIAGGETNIYPALREAYIQLAGATTQVKHVILLSDGRSLPDDFEGLTKKMADAKITVSTVAVGNGADRELLSQIAGWGHGRTYYLEDPNTVPQIFTEETELATGKTLREESFKPVVKKNVEAFKGIDFAAAPPLLGYVATKSKDTSEVLLESKRNDPILARWQYGLGKTAAFLSDLKDRWAVDWLRWNGYPKFWSQLVRETMRRRDDNEFDFRVVKDGDEAKISIDAIQKDGQFRNKLDTHVRVVNPDQSVSEVAVHQIGPGAYEAKYPLSKKGSYLFRAVAAESGGPSRVLAYSYPDEYHFYPPNTDLLRSISTETKGRFQPRAEDIFDANGETTALPTPLWPYLTVLALVLYLADVLLRRLRLFEG
jgi:Ca-activated chloride channel family protein